LLASGDWVLESEDDLMLGERCVETLVAHGEQHKADIIAPRRIWMRLGEAPETAFRRSNRAPGHLFNEWLVEHSTQALTADDVETPLLGATMLVRRTLFDAIQYDASFGTSSSWREESDFQLRALEHGYKLVFCPHAVTFHYSRASQSYGRNRIKGTVVYAYRVYRNNLTFLRRHRAYLRTHYPKSLFLGSPELSALLYGGYRAAWLLAAETLRFARARKYGGFSWK
jgi:GT2 family glycosyltransferase